MLLVKEATRSEISLVAVTRTTNSRAVVEKGAEKAEAKGKKGSSSKSAGAKGGDAAATETIIHQLRCKQRWCPLYLKGGCPKGDSCPFPHLDEENVNRIKAAERRQKEVQHEPDDVPERGRSPLRDKKGGKLRKSSTGSE